MCGRLDLVPFGGVSLWMPQWLLVVFWIGAFSNAFVGGIAADDSWSGLCGSLNRLVGLPGCGLVRRRRVLVVVPLVLQPSNAGSSSNADNLSQIALTLWVKPISDGSLPLATNISPLWVGLFNAIN